MQLVQQDIANDKDLDVAERSRLSLQFKTNKVIYRRYAGLYFSLCVDVTDNELAYLESIHLFVEILDHYFSNVCELDLVFNFHKVPSPATRSCCRCPQTALDVFSSPCHPVKTFVCRRLMARRCQMSSKVARMLWSSIMCAAESGS